eukprot:gene35443-43702_t
MDLSAPVRYLREGKQFILFLPPLRPVLTKAAMSAAPINNGRKKLPNPPIIIGITVKKIIKKACHVTRTLYNGHGGPKHAAKPTD